MEKENQDALKYIPEYNDICFDHFKNGGTLSSLPAKIPVRLQTLYRWMKDHEEFANAKERGMAEELTLLESCIRSSALGLAIPTLEKMGSTGINPESVKFLMTKKHRNEYSDKTQIEHSGQVTSIVFEEVSIAGK